MRGAPHTYAGLVALADALAGNALPEKSMYLRGRIAFTSTSVWSEEPGWPGQRKPRKIRRHAGSFLAAWDPDPRTGTIRGRS